MATTWGWINNLKLRNKLALLYTLAFVVMLGISFCAIYIFSEQYRQEEFYERLNDRTLSTLEMFIQVDQIDNNMLRLIDRNRRNSLSEEIILLFDSSGHMIYSTADVSDISFAAGVLRRLKGEASIYELSDDKYELLGMQFTNRGQTYYGIARAYDQFGQRKIRFLGILLVCTFSIVTIAIVILSFYLSTIVTKPITRLTRDVEDLSIDDLSKRVGVIPVNDEIGFLANKFNELLDKVDNAFKFQYHYIHHLSHELKTPLAIMMANAERALAEDDPEKLNTSMHFQKNSIMELSNIINALLDISRTEKKLTTISAERIRIDELLFECMDEILLLHPGFQFDFNIRNASDEIDLVVMGNSRMLKMAARNLLRNAINFSFREKPAIEIVATGSQLQIIITNDGPLLEDDDRQQLFRHLFRGRNSTSVKGFGLGLVLTHQVVTLHGGTLEYAIRDGRNCFTLVLPVG